MNMPPAMTAAFESVNRLRSLRVRTARDPLLLGIRDGQVRCVIQAPTVPDVLEHAHALTVGMAVKELVLVAEADADVTPAEGSPSEAGEARRLTWICMGRDRKASLYMQPLSDSGAVTGDPHPVRADEPYALTAMATALGQEPMSPAVVRTKEPEAQAFRRNDVNSAPVDFPTARAVLDVSSLQQIQRELEKGKVIFIPSGSEEAQLLVSLGLPEHMLVTGRP